MDYLEMDWLEFQNAFLQAGTLDEKVHELSVFFLSECYLHGLEPDHDETLRKLIDIRVNDYFKAKKLDDKIKLSFIIGGLCIGNSVH